MKKIALFLITIFISGNSFCAQQYKNDEDEEQLKKAITLSIQDENQTIRAERANKALEEIKKTKNKLLKIIMI
ncbi:MAG: hypothetical protein V4544_02040 [Pseudomonadota bacterium]